VGLVAETSDVTPAMLLLSSSEGIEPPILPSLCGVVKVDDDGVGSGVGVWLTRRRSISGSRCLRGVGVGEGVGSWKDGFELDRRA